MNLSWKNGPYEVFISGTSYGDFEETAVTNNANGGDGNSFWVVDSMTTVNLTLGYKFENGWRVEEQLPMLRMRELRFLMKRLGGLGMMSTMTTEDTTP